MWVHTQIVVLYPSPTNVSMSPPFDTGPRHWVQGGTSSCFLYQAAEMKIHDEDICIMHHVSCIMYHVSTFLRSTTPYHLHSCIMYHVSCIVYREKSPRPTIMYHVSCIVYRVSKRKCPHNPHVSCIMHHVSCIVYQHFFGRPPLPCILYHVSRIVYRVSKKSIARHRMTPRA